MIYHTITLYRSKFFHSERFNDWKDGLDNIREYYTEFMNEKEAPGELDFDFEEKRKGYEALMQIARETANKSCPSLKPVIDDLHKEFMRVWTNNDKEKEAVYWQSLEFITEGGFDEYKRMNDLLIRSK